MSIQKTNTSIMGCLNFTINFRSICASVVNAGPVHMYSGVNPFILGHISMTHKGKVHVLWKLDRIQTNIGWKDLKTIWKSSRNHLKIVWNLLDNKKSYFGKFWFYIYLQSRYKHSLICWLIRMEKTIIFLVGKLWVAFTTWKK